ncbi:hypothetical protein BBJ28_00018514 [Nothophytophthora sp. Chile5]|nr:hypothetical protein BBJ28_00018514 [Nothophytophthora sp. Chile5]
MATRFGPRAGQDHSSITVEQSDSWAQKAPKKRKCTYTARRVVQSAPTTKEEAATSLKQANEFRDHVRKLESEVAVLKARSSPVKDAIEMDLILQEAIAENAKLLYSTKSQQLHVAKAQSLVFRCLGDQQSHPLYTRIRLSKDWDKRRNTLMAMREKKLQTAYDFVMTSNDLTDSQKMQFSDSQFETAQGDYCGMRFGTVKFPGITSVQKVYDAVMFYFSSHEISISERLGHISVRDDYDAIDESVYNYRIISTNERGVVTEVSSLLFPRLSNDGSCGMIAIDSIDEDELYPYSPSERVRKDISATAVITLSRIKSKIHGEEDELMVTMRQAAFLKIHRPEIPMSEIAQRKLYDGIMNWGDVMLKSVRSIVYSTH